MEADLLRFYRIKPADLHKITWRQFLNLINSLHGVEGSLWAWIQKQEEEQWTPSVPEGTPHNRIVKGEQTKLWASVVAGAKRVEGPVNL